MAVDIISYALEDFTGKRFNMRVFVDAGGTLAELQAYSNALIADIDAVTACRVVQASVQKGLTLPGTLKADATDDMFGQLGANLSFTATGTAYRHTVRVPGVDESLVEGELIDVDDALVVALRTEILSGDGTLEASDAYGNDLLAFIEGKATFHK